MAKTPRDAIDEKMAEDGLDFFASTSLADFLADAGHGHGRADLLDIVNQLVNADVLWYLPAISSALGDLAEDSGEFAALVSDIAGRTRHDLTQGPFVDFLESVGSDRPDLAVRLARRLIKTGSARHAALLVGGAMRLAPTPCNDIAASLMRSKNAKEIEAGIECLRTAWRKDGIADAASGIRALAPVISRSDGAAAGEAMDALVDLYPAAGEEKVGRMIEDLARKNASSRSRLAQRIQLSSSPFDDVTAIRLLAVCAVGEPDPPTLDNVHRALARLSKKRPDAAIKAIVELLDAENVSDSMGHALQEIGRTNPGPLTTAILARFGADLTPAADIRLGSIATDIARHADPDEILGALFAALDSGGAAVARPALRMIKAMATLNCDATHDDELASRMLCRIVRHAQASGINVEHVLKKERSVHLKCAAVIRHIMHPPADVDRTRVMENLELFPALKRAFGSGWFSRKAKKGQAPHPLIACFSALSPERIESLRAVPPAETPRERFNRELWLRHESEPLDTLAFLDMALALLEGAETGTGKYARHMKNPDQFTDTVAEIALVVPFVAKQCRVELEPSVGKKQLDAAVELGPQRVLVEVLSPRMWEPLELLEGFRGIPMDRVPDKIFDKVEGQLLDSGARGDPIVIAIDTSRSETTLDSVVDYVLGPMTYTACLDTGAGRAAGGSAARDAEKCMHKRDARTDLISAVVCFGPTMSADPSAAVKGVIIENPYARVPLDPATRDALARILQCSLLDNGGQGGGGTR